MSASFGLGDADVFHCMLWRFVYGVHWRHHDSSPVITLSKQLFPSANWRERSEQTSIHRCFWSSDKIRGTTYAETFLVPKSSGKIFLTVSLSKFSSSAIIRTLSHLSDRTNFRTFYTFSSVRWVYGRPVHSSSFTSSRPSLNL
jgi:hypothetical protein